ncbi:NACHT, LRR and PYD domains-containing protein 12-like isoform X10 [Alosa alosa]|uniref:NACHT, LRR and PYD domains-containing protein 12-like isoform X10 n=1 Tax=Alosa alosa TaxID=278164 RepID=UPI0020150E1A|nr:NACHT, LRR and PYD domains-containing protein 12-like isoform X10 [Alosa alosa]
MSVPQEREEAAGPSETLSPESASHSCGTMKNDEDMYDPGSPTHSDGGTRSQTHRPPSPTPSSVSIKSNGSMHDPPTLDSGPAAQDKPDSVSIKRNGSMHDPPTLDSGQAAQPTPDSVSIKRNGSMHDPPTLNSGPAAQDKPDSVSIKRNGSMHDPPTLNSGPAAQPTADGLTADQLRDGVHEEALGGNNNNTSNEVLRRVIENHKACLKRKFENISEGIIKPGAEILLNKIYTELYITKGESEGVNKEYEVCPVESASRSQTTEDTPINCNDLFKPLPGQEKHIRTVITKGVAGIGKTVLVHKFILDWIDGIANQDVDFMFPLPFRELNLVMGGQYSLHRLLLDFHPELKELKDGEEYNNCQVVFIFDGLDESRLHLDFQLSMMSDVRQTASVDVLMTSLIQGSLFPSALIWITSRPAAAGQIPAQYINQVTEAQGFSDPQKEEYFRKRISNESQANRIISQIKASRSLYIMCHIPVLCWIAATVLEQLDTQQIPQTLTEMFIHFLLVKSKMKDQKYQVNYGTDTKRLLKSQKKFILKLAELAYKGLENGNLLFHEEDLIKCGIDVSGASEYFDMCTDILKEEPVLYPKKSYCFVHLSIQEFLAALYVFHSYVTNNLMALTFILNEEHRDYPSPLTLSCLTLRSVLGLQSPTRLDWLLKSALDKALKSSNGHLDLFIRFLMGMSLERNQKLLNGLLNHTYGIPETCNYIKKLNREDLSPEQCINLFQCLFEMNDNSIHKEIQKYLSSPKIKQKLSPAHCSTLSHMLLMSEEVLDEFDLKKCNTSNEGRRKLLPALRGFRKGLLAGCKLGVKSCGTVVSVLQSSNSLIELDLKHNDLGDSGFQLLSTGLFSPHCKLQLLRLAGCKLTNKSCELMASVLQSSNSLTELDLSTNDLTDSGVQLIFKEPHCKLQTLRLAECNLTETSCEIMASVLELPNSLIDLGLSHNDLRDSGVQFLSKGLSSPHCKLQTLRLSCCLISKGSCGFLASALSSKSSHLKELDLSYNHLGESGLNLLSARLEDPHCKLETLKTDHCAEIRLRPGEQKYACQLTVDPNTAHRNLALSMGNRKVTWVLKEQPYPDHPERFDWWHFVLCREDMSRRCYWEVEWSGYLTEIAVTYKTIQRKGMDADIILGRNAKSWSLVCSPDTYSAWHNNKETMIPAPSSHSSRVGVYLDWLAGTLSFYSVSSNTLTHLHTFHSTFTEPLCPGFRIYYHGSSVSLCQIT